MNQCLLETNSENYKIFDLSGNLLAFFKDGKFKSKTECIHRIIVNNISLGVPVRRKSPLLYLPSGSYRLANEESSLRDFIVTTAEREQKIRVLTDSKEITLTLNDSRRTALVKIGSGSFTVDINSFGEDFHFTGDQEREIGIKNGNVI